MRDPFDSLAGGSPAMQEIRRLGRLAAGARATVLLLGESGTGKELLARAIHGASGRRDGPFVAVNCAAVPEGLLEAEFFGYAEGAFTGARRGGKPGKFALAAGGTLFLDEVGELSPALQAKLLRALQEREVEPVGGVRPIPVDVRVVAASNRDLPALVAAGGFRLDLYYRLNVLTLQLPPLRERPEDIPELVSRLLARFSEAVPPVVTPAAMERLMAYHWPGNVRELENMLERALVLAQGGVTLGVEHFALPAGSGDATWRQRRRAAEREAVLGALARAGGNKTAAARLLGLSRSRFYEKLAELQ